MNLFKRKKKQDNDESFWNTAIDIKKWNIQRITYRNGVEIWGSKIDNGIERGVAMFLSDAMLEAIGEYLEANKC